MRYRTDSNQKAIVSILRELGASVELLHNVGSGCPDLLVGWRGKCWLLEVKGEASLKKFPNTNGRSPGQVEWHRLWKGTPVVTVTCPAEAVDALM